MNRVTLQQKIYYILQLAVAMCFIGHGAFGIITKPIWCNYFAVFGIGHDLAYRLMPVVGVLDILAGTMMLIYPIAIIPGWLIIWGIITALLRPLSGEPVGEFIERAGNFGVPMALLLLVGAKQNISYWIKPIKPVETLTGGNLLKVTLCLRITAFLLLLGHGWLNIIERQGLLNQYISLGFSNPAFVARVIGAFEIIAAFAILIKPMPSIIFGLLIWKMVSELFYPHYEFFEWVERGASYGTILALWFAIKANNNLSGNNLKSPVSINFT